MTLQEGYHIKPRDAARLARLTARAGLGTLAQRLRQGPQRADWSLRYQAVVRMMALGTPGFDGMRADDIRGPLEQVAVLAQRRPAARQVVDLGAFRAEWVTVAGALAGRTVLYLHGGGYVSGSPHSHRPVIDEIAWAAHAHVLAPHYRLAPEHPYPAALVDAWTSYWWLLKQGVPAGQIVVAGDSAGGGLTIALLLALRDAGAPLPAGAVGLSPWLDLAMTGGSIRANAASDYLNENILNASARMYLAGGDARDPLASPLYADLHGLPPLLIQVGTAEMLLDDSRRFAKRARAAGSAVLLEEWPGMVHVWHFTHRVEPRARQAIEHIGWFVAHHVDPKAQTGAGLATDKTFGFRLQR